MSDLVASIRSAIRKHKSSSNKSSATFDVLLHNLSRTPDEDDINLMSVPELRDALSEALKAQVAAIREKVAAQNKLRNVQGSTSTKPDPNATCYFLEKLPIELRNQIYGLLLVNKDLASPAALISNDPAHDPDNDDVWTHDEDDAVLHPKMEQWGLSPSILRTCHQIYAEASNILYGSNKFVLICMGEESPLTPINRDPLDDLPSATSVRSRNLHRRVDSFNVERDALEDCPAMAKVKHWKVLLSLSKADANLAPHPQFLSFCRSLTYAEDLKSLSVLIVPQGPMFDLRSPNRYNVRVFPANPAVGGNTQTGHAPHPQFAAFPAAGGNTHPMQAPQPQPAAVLAQAQAAAQMAIGNAPVGTLFGNTGNTGNTGLFGGGTGTLFAGANVPAPPQVLGGGPPGGGLFGNHFPPHPQPGLLGTAPTGGGLFGNPLPPPAPAGPFGVPPAAAAGGPFGPPLLPLGMLGGLFGGNGAHGNRGPTVFYHDIEDALKCLKLLRRVPKAEIREATGSDLPLYEITPNMSLMQSHVFTPGKLEDIVTLITGDKSTAHIFKMYHRLLTYCEAFERNEEFKTQMNPPYGFEKSILPPSQEDLLNDTRTRHPRFQFRTSLFDRLDPDSERYRDLLTLNPFKCKPAHPVERELSQCSMASEDNVWSQFVHSRKLIIEYLEPQYQRIVAASTRVNEFVKEMKRFGGPLSSTPLSPPHIAQSNVVSRAHPDFVPGRHVQGLVLLQEYAASFNRDMPLETKMQVCSNQRHWDLAYDNLPRETMLRGFAILMEQIATRNTRDRWGEDIALDGWGEGICDLFKKLVDDMDRQYLEIRAARKELFADDIAIFGVKIDLQKSRCDEMVDWSVDEPDMRTPNKDEELLFGGI